MACFLTGMRRFSMKLHVSLLQCASRVLNSSVLVLWRALSRFAMVLRAKRSICHICEGFLPLIDDFDIFAI